MFMLDTVDQIYIAYLPLAHVLELLSENTMLLFGIKVCNVYVLLDEKKLFCILMQKRDLLHYFCVKKMHITWEKNIFKMELELMYEKTRFFLSF